MTDRSAEKSARDEWIDLMLEIASHDREEYRRLRAAAWASVVVSHKRKSTVELTAWLVRAS